MKPRIVKTVTHQTRDFQGRRCGHVAYVQRRETDRMIRFGGLRFASWARRTVDGVETGAPERFETYKREASAVRHAEYAAGKSWGFR